MILVPKPFSSPAKLKSTNYLDFSPIITDYQLLITDY